MTNTMKRYLVAGIAIPVMIYVLMFLPSWVFHIMVTALMMMVLLEWLQLINGLKQAAPMILGMTMGVVQLIGIYAYAVSSDGKYLFLTTMLVVIGINGYGLINLAHDIKQRSTGNGTMLMAILVCGWGGGSMILLRELSFQPDGRFWVILLLAITWLGDTGAMHFGRWIGKHKLAPIISPKKTIEGLIAAVLCGLAGGFGAYFACGFTMPWWHILIIAPVIVVLAHVGDLTASMVKRAARVKDSSKRIPGHGGYLDRFDNVLLSAPFLYLYSQYLI